MAQSASTRPDLRASDLAAQARGDKHEMQRAIASGALALLIGSPNPAQARLEGLCRNAGLQTVTVDTDQDALKQIAETDISVVFVDVVHCEAYCPILLLSIRDLVKSGKTPILVAYGALIPSGLRMQLREAGADHVLHYPVEHERDVLEVLNTLAQRPDV